MAYCNRCGESIFPGQTFCKKCLPASEITTQILIKQNFFNYKSEKFKLWLSIVFLLFCAVIVAEDFFTNRNVKTFKKTSIGASIYQCVTSDGKLDVQSVKFNNAGQGVIVTLEKVNKTVHLKYAVDSNINQARMIGATVDGETDLTSISLLFTLELMCGGSLASSILPDTANSLRMLDVFR